MMSAFERGGLKEWELFVHDPARAMAALDAVCGIKVVRVLDIGCGSGQELLPFRDLGAFCLGLDRSSEVGRASRQLFAEHGSGSEVAFVRAIAEQLPFPSSTFDVLICRLALPYTINSLALAEMARVMRPGGVLLLKVHHARFYFSHLWFGLKSFKPIKAAHAAYVLAVGALYHLTGIQLSGHFLRTETFQTQWKLRRELSRHGLAIRREMPDSDARAPSFVIVK